MKSSHKHSIERWAVLLLLIGAALRFYRLDSQPLSGDEAYSVIIWVRSSLDYLIGTIALATTEPHPPLALISMNRWAALTGDSLVALRLFALLPGMLTLASAYRIASDLTDRRTAIIALGLMAISPFQVWYAVFARNYSLWMAGSAISIVFLIRAWKQPNDLKRWIPYLLASAFTGYIFYLEVFLYLVHNLYALIKVIKNPKHLKTWVGVQVTLGAILSVWYLRPELRTNSQDYEPNEGGADMLWGLQNMLFGDTLPVWLTGIGGIIVAGLIIVSLWAVIKTKKRDSVLLLAAYALLPITLLALLSVVTGRGYFHPRYIAANSIGVILLVAAGVSGLLAMRSWRRVVGGGLLTLIIGISAVGLWSFHFDPAFAKGPDWEGLFTLLNEQTDPDDLILRNFPDPAFDYYYDTLYTGGADWEIRPIEGNPDYDDLSADLATLMSDTDRVWFIPTPHAIWWDGDQQVARWLSEERLYLSDQWIGAMRLYQVADYSPASDTAMEPLGVDLGGIVRLEGYRLIPSSEHWEAGGNIDIELIWTPLAQTDSPLKIFAHLIGPPRSDGSPLWAQDDQSPQDGRIMSDSWLVGESFRDAYRIVIPLDAVGEYTLRVGLYDPATGDRLLTETGEDFVLVVSFSLP